MQVDEITHDAFLLIWGVELCFFSKNHTRWLCPLLFYFFQMDISINSSTAVIPSYDRSNVEAV